MASLVRLEIPARRDHLALVRLVVGHSLFSIAVVAYLVRARLVGLDAKLEEASADLYATPVTTFRRVTLPLAMPAVLARSPLSFTLSLDNLFAGASLGLLGLAPWFSAAVFGAMTAVMSLVGLQLGRAAARLVRIRSDLLAGITLLIAAVALPLVFGG